MKRILTLICWLFIFLGFSDVAAEEHGSMTEELSYAREESTSPPSCSDHGFECVLVGGFGMSLEDPSILSVLVAFRLSYLERIPLALEVSGIFPYGFGANLLIYVYRDERVLIHLIDFGIFHALGREITAPHISRDFDLVFGAGIEVVITPHFLVTLDWRVFLADPFSVLPNYADWGIHAYEKSARGVLWLGAAYSF